MTLSRLNRTCWFCSILLEAKRNARLPFEDDVEFPGRNSLDVARHFRYSWCLLQLGVEVCERMLGHPEFGVGDDGELLRQARNTVPYCAS